MKNGPGNCLRLRCEQDPKEDGRLAHSTTESKDKMQHRTSIDVEVLRRLLVGPV